MLKTILINNFPLGAEELKNNEVLDAMDITVIFNVHSLEGLIREMWEFSDVMQEIIATMGTPNGMSAGLEIAKNPPSWVKSGIEDRQWDEMQYLQKTQRIGGND